MDHVTDRQDATRTGVGLDHQVTVGRDVDGRALDVVSAQVHADPPAEGGGPGAPRRPAGCRRRRAGALRRGRRASGGTPRAGRPGRSRRRASSGPWRGPPPRARAGSMAASPSPGSSAMTGHETLSPTPTTTTARSWAAGARYPPEIVLPGGQSASASRPANLRSPSGVATTRSLGHFSSRRHLGHGLDRLRHGHRGRHRHRSRHGGGRAQQHRDQQRSPGRRHPVPIPPAPAGGLVVGDHHDALGGAVAGEGEGIGVRGPRRLHPPHVGEPRAGERGGRPLGPGGEPVTRVGNGTTLRHARKHMACSRRS